MNESSIRPLLAGGIAALCLLAGTAAADEGLWTFDNFPTTTVKSKYGLDIDAAWLDKLRGSVVRLQGCTGSFVSPDGAVLTNHHCVAACLDQLSSADNDLFERGIVARTRGEELRCPTQLADVLVAMEDVTADVTRSLRGLDERQANDARKKALTQLEEACEAKSKSAQNSAPLKCEAVTLYSGGQYYLYKYRRYTDLRVVFAPESAIAAFGGDPDNFQFPRWCLDVAVLRVYENNQPVRSANFLRMNFRGPNDNEVLFAAGHPGSTDRQLTVAQLIAQRNFYLPDWLLRSSELRGRLIQFGKTDDNSRRIAQDMLDSVQNTIKVRRKELEALLDDRSMDRKRADETALRQKVAANPEWNAKAGGAWDEIERALAFEQSIYFPYMQLEAAAGFNSRLFRYARQLVRGAAERDKPNSERLREFVDARLPRVEQQLSANVPFYPELELTTLSASLERMRELLGPDHPMVRRLLGKDSPTVVAKRLIDNSRLGDAKVRMELWKGRSAAIAASPDAMIQLVKSIEPESRSLRKQFDDRVEAPIRAAGERIAAARFATLGTSVYPDANYTLRINYGTVQGWSENGWEIRPYTYLDTAFGRATDAEPFRMPDSWTAVRSQLDMRTPFNMSTTHDIVGGSSGSPLVNAKGEVVGVLFDGNIHSVAGSFWFDMEKNRAVAVHPAIMREALRKVYKADALLRELGAQ